MRVLFLTHRLGTPSVRWRVLQFVPHLAALGIQADVVELVGGPLGRWRRIRRAKDYDLVVLAKRLLGPIALGELRRRARRLLFEFDDAIPYRRTRRGVEVSPTRAARFERVLRAVDAVTTTHDYLVSLVRERVPERAVASIPNGIDLAAWPRPAYERAPAPTIGWSGTAGNWEFVEAIAPALRALARERPGLRVVAVCDRKVALPGVPVETVRFDAAREPELLRGWHAALAPLPDDPWTRGKCPVKVLTYLAAGLPVVASDVAPHRLYLEAGRTAVLVGPRDDWAGAVASVLDEPAQARALAQAGRREVEARFRADVLAKRLGEFYREVAG